MSVSLKLDSADFQKTLNQYLAVTSKTLPQALNEKMFYIVRGASRETPKNDRAKIEQQLQVAGYALRYTKNGKRLRKASQQGKAGLAMMGGTLVYRIINSRRAFAGKPGLKRTEMTERAARFLAARFRSVGTLKAGWWGALRELGRAVGQEGGGYSSGSMNRVTNPSVATIAQDGFNPSVSIEYRLLAKDPRHQRNIDQRVQDALESAWSDELKSMKEYLIKKLQGGIDAVRRGSPTRVPVSTYVDSIRAQLRH